MLPRLELLYGPDRAPKVLEQLLYVIERWREPLAKRPRPEGAASASDARGGLGLSQRDAMLITYADTIVETRGGADPGDSTDRPHYARPPLQVLEDFLARHIGDRLSIVHLLPFYPWTSDDGFSVSDLRAVNPEVGSWADVESLARWWRLAFDGVINHVSAASDYVQGHLAGDPRYADFCIDLPQETDTSSVLRTRNLPLLHDYGGADGRTHWLWTTFSRDQVDLNYANPAVLAEIVDVLLGYAAHGASVIRLDAIPYLWKELGTSCAHLPQTHEAIRLLRDVFDAACPEVLLLAEANVPHRQNVTYWGHGGDESQVIYNFTLPPLVVHTLLVQDASALTSWAADLEAPGPRATWLNITATHDGIGMRPTEGLLPEADRQRLVDMARDRGGDITGKRNADGSVSPYELNISYFDAVNDPAAPAPPAMEVRRFMLSQSIPLVLQGLPGIYVQSLLGSRNDHDGVGRTGRARSINRTQHERAALERELDDRGSLRHAVLRAYLHLLAVRAEQPALSPSARQEVLQLGPRVFGLLREGGGQTLAALHNVTGEPLEASDVLGRTTRDMLTGERFDGAVPLGPWGFRWLVPV